MENKISQQLNQRQTQQLTQQLTPTQLQSLNLLNAPLQELSNLLAAELAENPLLEVLSPPQQELAGDPVGEATMAGNELSVNEFDGDREDFPLLKEYADSWESAFDSDSTYATEDSAELQKRHDYQFDSLVLPRTLVDILYEQLDFCTITPRQRKIAELLIGSLDERGFLTTHLADIAMIANASMPEVEQALQLLQSFEPPGVGARDAVESLKLQLQRRNYQDKRIYTLLDNYSHELERNKLPQIAKAMQISLDEVYGLINTLKTLNCIPTVGIDSRDRNMNVIPEMSIELENDQIVIHGHENMLPKLGLAGNYLKMLDDPNINDETRKYLREKLANAENLLKSLAQRQDTITRITQVIAEKQQNFFRFGVEFLQPMTMLEAAQMLDLHETTISRAVAGKYLDTPQGLLEYRFFFSNGYKNAEGEDVSSRGIKAIIRQLIDQENPAKPLSDAAIAAQLAAQGLNIARRTIAKYRESMNIAPTNLRRKH